MLCIRLFISALQEKIIKEEEIALIIYVTLVIVLLAAMVIVFFVAFQKRKNKLLLDKIKQKKAYENEISKTKLEIQEQTLKFVGQELHDNVGQLLVYAKMQLGMLDSKVEGKAKQNLKETSNIVSDSLAEVRALSKSLNSDVLMNIGLLESVENEIKRLKSLSFSTVSFFVEGEPVEIANESHELVLIRILQEFFSNTVKYSEANSVDVKLIYTDAELRIEVYEDGSGFDVITVKKGSGLINMESRAKLIGAYFDLQSEVGSGTKLTIIYPISDYSETINKDLL
ncbi:MAG: histidine kinase [Bacteroidota bacterium]